MPRLHASTSSIPGRGGQPSFSVATLVACVAGGRAGAAQSTLGTIRGTVSDAQGAVVPGATVVVTDEDTGVTREVVSTSDGLFEVPNLRPGSYTVDVNLAGFKAREADRHPPARRVGGSRRRPARGGHAAGRRHRRRRGPEHHRGESVDCARSRRPAVARPAAQQPRHPGLPDPQPERRRRLRLDSVPGRTHLRRLVHPGRAAVLGRDLRRAVQRRAGPRCRRRSAGALQLVQRRVRRPRWCRRLDQARHEPDPRDVVLRLQQQRAERPDLCAGAQRRLARRPERRHARPSIRLQHRRPDPHEPDVLLRQLRGRPAQGARRRGAGDRPEPVDACRRLLGRQLRDQGSADRPAVSRQPHSRQPPRSSGAEHHRGRSTRTRTRPRSATGTARTGRSCRSRATATVPTAASITS